MFFGKNNNEKINEIEMKVKELARLILEDRKKETKEKELEAANNTIVNFKKEEQKQKKCLECGKFVAKNKLVCNACATKEIVDIKIVKKKKQHDKAFKLGKLYFLFIKGTELEEAQYTTNMIAELLEENDFIETFIGQKRDKKGRLSKRTKMYRWKTGKEITRKEFNKIFKLEVIKKAA